MKEIAKTMAIVLLTLGFVGFLGFSFSAGWYMGKYAVMGNVY